MQNCVSCVTNIVMVYVMFFTGCAFKIIAIIMGHVGHVAHVTCGYERNLTEIDNFNFCCYKFGFCGKLKRFTQRTEEGSTANKQFMEILLFFGSSVTELININIEMLGFWLIR